jgi:hypothetical protein
MKRDSFLPTRGALVGKALIGVILAGCFACFAVAASALSARPDDVGIVSVSSVYATRPALQSRSSVMLEGTSRSALPAELARVDR